MFDSDRYRWDDVSHWKADFPHVFKYQVREHKYLPQKELQKNVGYGVK